MSCRRQSVHEIRTVGCLFALGATALQPETASPALIKRGLTWAAPIFPNLRANSMTDSCLLRSWISIGKRSPVSWKYSIKLVEGEWPGSLFLPSSTCRFITRTGKRLIAAGRRVIRRTTCYKGQGANRATSGQMDKRKSAWTCHFLPTTFVCQWM